MGKSAIPATSDECRDIPIILAVSGHRAIPDGDEYALAKTASAFFNDLKGKYTHTKFLMLTGIAEGADRLVAESA